MAINQTKAGTWEVDHYYFDTEGKRRRKWRRFDKYKEAVAYEKETLAAVQKQEFILPSKKTVRELTESWFARRFANGAFSWSTQVERNNHLRNYILPAFGSMLVQNLSVERIELQMDEWRKRIGKRKKSPIAAEVVNRVLRTLTEILAEAKRYKIIRDNPAKEAKRLKEEAKKEHEIFTQEELKRVIEATEPGSRERIVVMTLAFTGLRISELLGASWSAVDLKNGRFYVHTSLGDSPRGVGPVFKEPKNKKSKRSVPLPKELVHELRLWKLKCPPSERDLVMASDRGKPTRRMFACLLLKRLRKELKIERRLTPHSFRHTFSSLLLAKKRPVPEVSALLGHKNERITLAVYSHFVPGEETDAVQDVADSVLSSSATEVLSEAENR